MSTQAIQVHGQSNGQAIQTQAQGEYEGLIMVVSPAEALRRVQELQAFVQQVMVKDVDFGTIPGTDKPTLLQPGAQKLAEIYGFAIDFEDVNAIEDWDRGFFLYRKKCVLTSRRDGRFICASIGSCNSKEGRYSGRWAFDNEVPAGLDKRLLKMKKFTSKKNHKEYTQYRIPNEDIFSLVNTIEKMACKRALVGAVISATRSAGVFTQDAEDLPAEAFGKAEVERSWDRAPAEAAAPGRVIDAEVEPSAATAGYLARVAASPSNDDLNALWNAVKADAAMTADDRKVVGDACRVRRAALTGETGAAA